MASVLFMNLRTEHCLSAHQFDERYISTFYMKYNQSMLSEHNYGVYQRKEKKIQFDFVAATIFEIRNKL